MIFSDEHECKHLKNLLTKEWHALVIGVNAVQIKVQNKNILNKVN